MSYDIVIRNGKIVDGTGNSSYKADIGIKDEKITKISSNISQQGETELDALNLVVSPGFIDPHSHADMSLPFDCKLPSLVHQGITTVVVGNCGFSMAPISEEEFRFNLLKKEIDIFSPPNVTTDLSWRTFDEYLSHIHETGLAINFVPLVGFGTIRIAGGPAYEDRFPNTKELSRMKTYIEEAMRAGAFGMSTGLIYTPQSYAKTEEIIELAKIVAEYDGLYFSHIRGEGKTIIKAINEFIEIVKQSGCKGGQIAHHKVSGNQQWGRSQETLKLISDANKQTLNITCDQYPYNRGMTSLITVLPPWTHIGGIDNILERLRNPESRNRIKEDILKGIEGWENWIKDLGFSNIFISSVKTERWKTIEGKNISEITKEMDYSNDFETLFDILLDEKGEVTMTIENMGEEDIRRIMKSKYTMFGTDAWAASPEGALSSGKPHPRFYGTYPRILGKYCRELGLFSLETAIRKMTSFPAQKLGLFDRGLIREGMTADLVIFHSHIIDVATYTEPHQFSKGIHYVIVNGSIAVENQKQIDILNGKVLRKINRISF